MIRAEPLVATLFTPSCGLERQSGFDVGLHSEGEAEGGVAHIYVVACKDAGGTRVELEEEGDFLIVDGGQKGVREQIDLSVLLGHVNGVVTIVVFVVGAPAEIDTQLRSKSKAEVSGGVLDLERQVDAQECERTAGPGDI